MAGIGQYIRFVTRDNASGGLHVFCAVPAWSRVRFVRFADNERAATTLALPAECFDVPLLVLVASSSALSPCTSTWLTVAVQAQSEHETMGQFAVSGALIVYDAYDADAKSDSLRVIEDGEEITRIPLYRGITNVRSLSLYSNGRIILGADKDTDPRPCSC